MAGGFIPTQAGLVEAGIISFILLFPLFIWVAKKRLAEGESGWRYFFFVTFLFFSVWLIVLPFGEIIFEIDISSYLSEVALYSILLPYFLNVLLYSLGTHLRFRW